MTCLLSHQYHNATALKVVPQCVLALELIIHMHWSGC